MSLMMRDTKIGPMLYFQNRHHVWRLGPLACWERFMLPESKILGHLACRIMEQTLMASTQGLTRHPQRNLCTMTTLTLVRSEALPPASLATLSAIVHLCKKSVTSPKWPQSKRYLQCQSPHVSMDFEDRV